MLVDKPAASGLERFRSVNSRRSDDERRSKETLLTAYQKRKQEEITHPFLQEKIKIGLLPAIQAGLLAKHLRSELDPYPPFIWK